MRACGGATHGLAGDPRGRLHHVALCKLVTSPHRPRAHQTLPTFEPQYKLFLSLDILLNFHIKCRSACSLCIPARTEKGEV